jgi:anti-anti-sigma factor
MSETHPHPLEAPRPASRVRVREEGEIVLVTLVDRSILDVAVLHQIGEEIGGLIDARPEPRLIVDFSEVELLSSSGLSVLIAIHKKIRAKDGKLCLAGMTTRVHQIFTVTQLDKIFTIHRTIQEAIDGLA